MKQVKSKAGKSEATPAGSRIHASRTIINYVISRGEGVLSSNAMSDQQPGKAFIIWGFDRRQR